MNVGRALALAKKDWKRIFREPAFLFIIILFPVMLTVAFGTSFGAVGGSQTPTFKIGIVDFGPGGNSTSAGQFVDDLRATGVMNVQHFTDNTTAQSVLSQGQLQGVILLPSSFDSTVQSYKSYPNEPGRWVNSTVSLYLDKGSLLSPQIIPSVVGQALEQGVLGIKTVASVTPFTVSSPSLVNVEGSSVFAMFAPGLFAFASIYMIMMVAQSYTTERENGLLSRILVTPATSADVIMGSVMSYLVIGLVQALLVFLCVFALGYHPVASPVGLLAGFLIVTVFALCNIGFGLITAAISRSASAATGISFLFLMPQLFLGTFVGTALSATAQTAGRFVPAYYVTDALTSLFTRGAAVTSQTVLTDLAVVSASSIIILLAGIQVFKRFGKT
ncbi:MAG: ABC transporter permease [Nitrososphaerales archaeon]|jgi:ABC-2 type transport system permease protein